MYVEREGISVCVSMYIYTYIYTHLQHNLFLDIPNILQEALRRPILGEPLPPHKQATGLRGALPEELILRLIHAHYVVIRMSAVADVGYVIPRADTLAVLVALLDERFGGEPELEAWMQGVCSNHHG